MSSELQHYQIALTYINAFPKDAKYVALFPSGQAADILDINHNSDGDKKPRKTDQIRFKAWNLCKAAVEEGRSETLVLHASDLEEKPGPDIKDDDNQDSKPRTSGPRAKSVEKSTANMYIPDIKERRRKTTTKIDHQKRPQAQTMQEVDDFFLSADTDAPTTS